ncbi:MAG: cbb3-type cytochrome c oxidase subunit II [Pseudomonadota bacterium]|uniref:cbb3-type cytochrome c oxidase subunit II n=1 Tax=Thermithiobacillus tepidarius TaxID=929 RepID=UPI0004921B35|nr:cbb3-type cytochrome c oxidase subunit II [Thermithiobacillus tepidarius]
MSRVLMLLIGALAAVTFAAVVLVAVPKALLAEVKPPPQLKPYTAEQARGRAVYMANGCIYCHTQQIRDPAITTDAQRGWGRPSVPADYYYDQPHLLGTMRTGPDLFNVGARLPDPQWQLLHLYQPRALVPWSIMPAFPFLFELKAQAAPGDTVVKVPAPYAPPGQVVVAKPEALALVAYLLSLNHTYPSPESARPEGTSPPKGQVAQGGS